jgi:hypothetical protein
VVKDPAAFVLAVAAPRASGAEAASLVRVAATAGTAGFRLDLEDAGGQLAAEFLAACVAELL